MKDYLLRDWQLDTLVLEVHPVELSIIATSSTAGFESMVWLERLLDHRQIIFALVQNVLDFSWVEFSSLGTFSTFAKFRVGIEFTLEI